MPLPRVAYFSMEIAIDASLYTYTGGLGYLAGSHMLSAGHLNLPMVGVTMLWSQGYGDQVISPQNTIELTYSKRNYPFLKDTGVVVEVEIYGEPVKVKGLLLEPKTFGTVPVYYLTTDLPENKPEHRDYSNVIYAGDERARIAQEVILGRGGYKVLEAVGEQFDLVHINEGHALPAFFEMLTRYNGDFNAMRQRAVFTTHTPVAYGNESHSVHLLAEAGFFANTSVHDAIGLGGESFNLTVAALKMARLANAVSQLHGRVANNMWSWVDGRCPIVAITNAVSKRYWQDERMVKAKSYKDLLSVKHQMKQELFARVKKETGVKLDPDVLTLVWARRFTGYKRPDLLFREPLRIDKLLKEKKIQILYAGKFHPNDTSGREAFNAVLAHSKHFPGMAVLTNYDLALSGLMKRGSDVWLNNPLRPLEASGTSGMSANMNGSIHVSTYDGWAVEGTYDGLNGYIINEGPHPDHLSQDERNHLDYTAMMDILENKVIPMYYGDKAQWAQLMRNAMYHACAYFDSDRMAIEYFTRLYNPTVL